MAEEVIKRKVKFSEIPIKQRSILIACSKNKYITALLILLFGPFVYKFYLQKYLDWIISIILMSIAIICTFNNTQVIFSLESLDIMESIKAYGILGIISSTIINSISPNFKNFNDFISYLANNNIILFYCMATPCFFAIIDFLKYIFISEKKFQTSILEPIKPATIFWILILILLPFILPIDNNIQSINYKENTKITKTNQQQNNKIKSQKSSKKTNLDKKTIEKKIEPFIAKYKDSQSWSYKLWWNWVFLIIGIIAIKQINELLKDLKHEDNKTIIEYDKDNVNFITPLQSICLFFLISNIFNLLELNINNWITIILLAILNISIWRSKLFRHPIFLKIQLQILLTLSTITTLFIIPRLFM